MIDLDEMLEQWHLGNRKGVVEELGKDVYSACLFVLRIPMRDRDVFFRILKGVKDD